jgi:hypothetical protein
MPHSPDFLHVLNGDATRSTIERSEVPGDFMVWADVLHEGPVPSGLEDEDLLAVRAHFIASRGWATYQEAVETQRRWADTLSSFRDYDELVLWFEHDLFDQLLLIRHLDWYGRQSRQSTPVSLICIGDFPGVARFDGLGQLNADQLASLLGTRQHVSLKQIELARSAWRAFRSDSPIPLLRFVERDTSALPFLNAALQRFLEEYPDIESGLPRTERTILEALVSGPRTPSSLFAENRKREEAVFMGDSTFWTRVQTLASGPAPLLQLKTTRARDQLPDGEVSLTSNGLRVLAGEADWIDLNGIDRWLGGVHLHTHAPWRWDRERRTIVRSQT